MTMHSLVPVLSAAGQDARDIDIESLSGQAIEWALTCGLGPLLYRANRAHPRSVLSPHHALLVGADLTARAITAEMLDSLEEVLKAATAAGIEIALLKGISICQRHYPEPHLRAMGDMDLLVRKQAQPAMDRLLHELGYRQQSSLPPEYYMQHHHSMPFFHPQRRVWIEVHSELFPHFSKVANDRVFSVEHVWSQLIEDRFRGIRVAHLCDELHAIYLCAHWPGMLKPERALMPVLDMVYMLNRPDRQINWDQVLESIAGSSAASDVYLMLSLLERHRLAAVPPEILRRIKTRQKNIHAPNLLILHALFDSFILSGRPFGKLASSANTEIVWTTLLSPHSPLKNLASLGWNLLFPPSHPGRFNVKFQLRRMASALGFKRH